MIKPVRALFHRQNVSHRALLNFMCTPLVTDKRCSLSENRTRDQHVGFMRQNRFPLSCSESTKATTAQGRGIKPRA